MSAVLDDVDDGLRRTGVMEKRCSALKSSLFLGDAEQVKGRGQGQVRRGRSLGQVWRGQGLG